jgi:hypothetical protein
VATSQCRCTIPADCDDRNPCTDDDCVGERCDYSFNVEPCADDGNECTGDYCEEGTCIHPAQTGPCTDDMDDCTDDLCGAGVCTHPDNGTCGCDSPADCDDSDPCTDDECVNEECDYLDNTAPCGDDGNQCTDDVCNAGDCTHPANNTCGGPCASLALTRSGAVASSEYLAMMSNAASRAVDNDTTTRWESVHGTDPQWIYVDLGANRHISNVQIDWETAAAKNYVIQVAPDGTCVGAGPGCLATNTPWFTAFTSPTHTTNPQHRIDTALVGTLGRYVRMYGTARMTAYGYSIWELRVNGDTDTTCEP